MANQKGNIRARQGKGSEAVREYESALRMDPDNPVYKENCAAACIEMDMVHRAEELLAQIEPDHPSASVYNLLGQVAALKGERARAELSYTVALERDPWNPELRSISQSSIGSAGTTMPRGIFSFPPCTAPGSSAATALLQLIRDEEGAPAVVRHVWSEWWVPRNLPQQQALRVRGEPPAHAPGRRCPSAKNDCAWLRFRLRARDALRLP